MDVNDIKVKIMSEEATAKTLFSKTVEAVYTSIKYGSLDFIDIQMKILTDKNNMGSFDLTYEDINITGCYFNRDCYRILSYSRSLIKTMFWHLSYRKRLSDSEIKYICKEIKAYKVNCDINYKRTVSLAGIDEGQVDFDHYCNLLNYVTVNMLYFYYVIIQRESRFDNYEVSKLTSYFEEIQNKLERELTLFDIRVGELK